MALNIREVGFDNAHIITMLKDIKDITAIPPNIRKTIWDAELSMKAIANDEPTMNKLIQFSSIMKELANYSIAANAIFNSDIAKNIVLNSDIAMAGMASSSVAMNIIASSPTLMTDVVNSYAAINAMTTIEAFNALKNSSITDPIQTLITNINNGNMQLGNDAVGDSTHIGLNGLLVLLATNNGSAVTPGNNTDEYSSNTLAQKLDSAFGSLEIVSAQVTNATVTMVDINPNQIVFAVKESVGNYDANGPNSMQSTTASGHIIYAAQNAPLGTYYPNDVVPPLQLSGSITLTASLYGHLHGYYLSYTPS